MSAGLGDLIDVGVDVLSTAIDAVSRRIFAYLGDVKAQDGESDKATWMQHVGFASRPGRPIAGKSAAQCVRIRRSDGDVVLGSCDARTLAMYGALDDGETCIFAGGPDGTAQGRSLWKKDGSVNHYTRVGNSPDGAGMIMQLDAANNAVRLLNGLGFGIIADADGVTITAGAATITIAQDGKITIVGSTTTQLDGASIVLGANPTLNPVSNQVMVNPASLIQFLTSLVAAIATITTVTPGATAMTPMAALLALLSPGTPGTGLGALKVTAE